MNEDLRYPIGKFEKPDKTEAKDIEQWIEEIEAFPERLSRAVTGLTNRQLDTPYREGGWTVRQVVHHCADSHMNSFVRFKLSLTEDKPTIKPYFENRWAELPDGKTTPIEPSLAIIKGLHQRWGALLRSLNSEQLSSSFIHPEHGREIGLAENIALYAWHSNHHLAHIRSLVKKMDW